MRASAKNRSGCAFINHSIKYGYENNCYNALSGDGDAIFTLATGDIEVDPAGYGALEVMATRALERAILKGVRLAEGLAGVPSVSEWQASARSSPGRHRP